MSVSRFVESVCVNIKQAGLLVALAGSVAGVTGQAKGDVDFSFSLSFGNVFSWCEPVYVCPPAVVVTPVYCPPPVVIHRPWSYCPPTYYHHAPVYSYWRGWDDCDDRWVYRPVTSVTTTTYFGHYSSYTTTYSSFGYGHYGYGYRRPVYYGHGYGSGLSLNFFFGDDDDDCDRDWRHDRYRRDRHDRDHRDYRDRDRDRDRDYGRGRDNQPIFQSNNNVTVNNYGPVGPQTIQQVGPVGPNAGGVFPASNAGGNASGFASGPATGLDGREGPRAAAKPMRFGSEQEARAADRARDNRGARERAPQERKPVFAAEPARVAEVENQKQPQAFGPVGPAVSKPVVRRPVESTGKQPPAARPGSAVKPTRNSAPAFAAEPVSEPVVKPAGGRPATETWAGPRGPEKPVVNSPAAKPGRVRESSRESSRETGRAPAVKRPVFEAGEIRVEQPRAPRSVEKAPAFTPQPAVKPASPSSSSRERQAESGPRPASKPMRVSQPTAERPAAPRPSLKAGERPARLSDMQRPARKSEEKK